MACMESSTMKTTWQEKWRPFSLAALSITSVLRKCSILLSGSRQYLDAGQHRQERFVPMKIDSQALFLKFMLISIPGIEIASHSSAYAPENLSVISISTM